MDKCEIFLITQFYLLVILAFASMTINTGFLVLLGMTKIDWVLAFASMTRMRGWIPVFTGMTKIDWILAFASMTIYRTSMDV